MWLKVVTFAEEDASNSSSSSEKTFDTHPRRTNMDTDKLILCLVLETELSTVGGEGGIHAYIY